MKQSIQLTGRNVAGFNRGVSKAAAIEMSVQRLESLARLHALVMNDSHAFSHQTLGQYRGAIAAAISKEMGK